MKTTEDHFVSDADFEVLLRHALLEKEQLFIPQTIEIMANQTFSLVNIKDISEAKSEQVIEKLASDFKSGGSKFRLNIFLLSLFTLAIIATVIFFTSQEQKNNAKIISGTVVLKDNLKPEPVPTIMLDEINGNPLPRINPVMAAIIDTAQKEDSFDIQQINNGDAYTIPTTLHIPEDKILHYEDIPTLTEEQKKQTQTDKMKMLRDILNPKRKIYMYVGAGTTKVDGACVSVGAFFIKSSEVTNAEYHTFLNDLIMQGNFDDYLIAAPVKEGWKALGIPEFENVYFENEKYNSFPVVNITRKGAELYCKWLTTEMNAAIDRKDIKYMKGYSVFNLPTKPQWEYAARACDSTIQTPWEKYAGPNTLQNKIGCYLCNFNYSLSKDKVSPEGPHMNKNNSKGCVAAKMSTRAIVTTAARAIDTLVTAPVFSYNPNDIGLYCTLGNVSEMVWAKNAAGEFKEARSMGGSWYSDMDNVKIEAPEQYVGVTEARAYIGFRPVMTFIAK